MTKGSVIKRFAEWGLDVLGLLILGSFGGVDPGLDYGRLVLLVYWSSRGSDIGAMYNKLIVIVDLKDFEDHAI